MKTVKLIIGTIVAVIIIASCSVSKPACPTYGHQDFDEDEKNLFV